jgi:hypothetical protein
LLGTVSVMHSPIVRPSGNVALNAISGEVGATGVEVVVDDREGVEVVEDFGACCAAGSGTLAEGTSEALLAEAEGVAAGLDATGLDATGLDDLRVTSVEAASGLWAEWLVTARAIPVPPPIRATTAAAAMTVDLRFTPIPRTEGWPRRGPESSRTVQVVRLQPVVKLIPLYRAGYFALPKTVEPGRHAGALSREPDLYGDVCPVAALLAEIQDLATQHLIRSATRLALIANGGADLLSAEGIHHGAVGLRGPHVAARVLAWNLNDDVPGP